MYLQDEKNQTKTLGGLSAIIKFNYTILQIPM